VSDEEIDPEEPGSAPVDPATAGVPDDTWTMGEARAWLLERVEHGHKCPLCTQFTKIYRRKVNAAMARALILMWREGDLGRRLYVHVPSIDPTRGGDVAKMAFWGLIEEERAVRADGGRAGFWRVTRRGEDWIQGKVTIPKYARVYDNRLLSISGPATSINDALGDFFRLDDLMEGI
jgi:hypothetical protein